MTETPSNQSMFSRRGLKLQVSARGIPIESFSKVFRLLQSLSRFAAVRVLNNPQWKPHVRALRPRDLAPLLRDDNENVRKQARQGLPQIAIP